jgi:dihydrolipoamide dehydrogenase
MTPDTVDVLVLGGGPAGLVAAIRAGDLGARTALVTRDAFGGMAAVDGPVPVRTLAHAARLVRDARQLGRYGIAVSDPVLDYPRLLARVREVVDDARAHAVFRHQVDAAGVAVHEHAGIARFADAHTVETHSGLRFHAEKIILCTGGVSRRLAVPGFELTATHSDAWGLTSAPPTMLVVGAGATGAQVASIFNAFGTRVELFQAAPRILPTEDEDVSTAVAAGFRAAGIAVHEDFGSIESFEEVPGGVRMNFAKDGVRGSAEGGGGRRRGRLDGGHGRTRPREGWRRHRSPGLRERRLRLAHHRAAHLRRRGRDRSSDARPASDTGRLRRRDECRARAHAGERRRGGADREFHRPRIRAGRHDRGEGA